MVTLVVHYQAKPETAGEVARSLIELMEISRAEEGCIRFEVTQALDDPTRFLLFEQYVDERALEAHTASAQFQRLVLTVIVPQLLTRVRERFVAE